MFYFFVILGTIVSYLLGSIPSSVWIGKVFYGIDVREHGSGNAGTTNTFRVLGVKAAIPVFLIDVLKAFVAALLGSWLSTYSLASWSCVIPLLFGLVAVLGHIFPIYVGFKGGKGVASLLGVALAVTPQAVLFALVVFVIVLLISHYVSLSSMSAGCSYPFFVFFVGNYSILLKIFAIVIAAVILVTHRKNIARLRNGEESKIF